MVSFDNPLWLLALPVIIWVIRTGLRLRLPPLRRACVITGRVGLTICLLLLGARVRTGLDDNQLHVTFLWDQSASLTTENQDKIRHWLQHTLLQAPHDASWSVLGFARDVTPMMQNGRGPGHLDQPALDSGDFAAVTHLERALRIGQAGLPTHGRRRLVVISDGQETVGRAHNLFWELRRDQVTVDVRLLGGELAQDVIVDPIEIPERIAPGAPFAIHVPLRTPHDVTGELIVKLNGEIRSRQPLHLPAGRQRLKIEDKILESGGHRLDVIFQVPDDPRQDNNTSAAYLTVAGEESVLLLGSLALCQPLLDSLRAARIPCEHAEHFPRDLAEWNRFGAVWIVDLPAIGVDPEQLVAAQRYVEELGGGLAMLGSRQTFAAGGYYQTPVEQILPVTAKPRTEMTWGTVAMAIVVDQSGSMGATVSGGQSKMQLANQGAASTVDLLNPMDYLGVSMVDTRHKWLTKGLERLGNEENKRLMKNKILANKPGGGGIYVYTGLEAAFNAIQSIEATSRHIILYADGADAEQQNGCAALVRKMLAQGITLSTVSLGNAHDTPFLQRLANLGDGRSYITRSGADVQQIFTRETSLAARRTLIEGDIQPLLVTPTSLWSEPEGMPLRGYVVTSLKDGAELMLRSNHFAVDPQGQLSSERAWDPILARWFIGLGKSLAFTSDAAGLFSAEFLSSEVYRDFWPRCARWLIRDPLGEPLSVRVDPLSGRVDIRALEGELPPHLTLQITDEQGSTKETVQRLSHTLAEATLDPTRPGSSTVISVFDGERVLGRTTAILRGTRELRQLGPHWPLAEALTQETGGQLFTGAGDVWRAGGPALQQTSFPRLGLAWAAALFLLLDICGRRFPAFKRSAKEPTLATEVSPCQAKTPAWQKSIDHESLETLETPPGPTLPPPESVEPPTSTAELLRRKRKRR